MSYLKVKNKIIVTPIKDILEQVHTETKGRYLKQMIVRGSNIGITCPFHSEGNEYHPSCYIVDDFSRDDNGVYHCFACGSSGTLLDLIAFCFQEDVIFATEWLEERFADSFVMNDVYLPEITLKKDKLSYLDENILEQYRYFHPYMFERHLTEEIIRKFQIGCTSDGRYITFPCWDEHNNLVGIYMRSTINKEFIIPKNIKKCVYLLNYCINNNITTVYVCESQFNALTLYVWGYNGIALFGTGSKEQYEILKRSGIRNYILCFDGDSAGDKARERFIRYMPKDIFITSKILPRGKDVNDLSKEEFDNLPVI